MRRQLEENRWQDMLKRNERYAQVMGIGETDVPNIVHQDRLERRRCLIFRVTADTNIYICGLIFPGASRRFLKLARQGVFELAVSDAILDEIGDVLQRRFGMPLQESLHQTSKIVR